MGLGSDEATFAGRYTGTIEGDFVFEQLERYARDADAEHLSAWRRFNRLVRGSGDVGIWHEHRGSP